MSLNFLCSSKLSVSAAREATTDISNKTHYKAQVNNHSGSERLGQESCMGEKKKKKKG